MWVAPCSSRTRISLIFESTSESKIGIAAPPDSSKTYSTPSRSRQRISASAPVCSLVTGLAAGGAAAGADLVAGLVAGLAGTENLAFEVARSEATSIQPIRPEVLAGYFDIRCRFDLIDALFMAPVSSFVLLCRHKPRLARAIRIDRAPGGRDLGREAGPEQRPLDLRLGEAALEQEEPPFDAAALDADCRVADARVPVVSELRVDVEAFDVE